MRSSSGSVPRLACWPASSSNGSRMGLTGSNSHSSSKRMMMILMMMAGGTSARNSSSSRMRLGSSRSSSSTTRLGSRSSSGIVAYNSMTVYSGRAGRRQTYSQCAWMHRLHSTQAPGRDR